MAMSSKLLWLLVLCCCIGNVSAQMRFEASDFPPKQWSIFISIIVSPDLSQRLLEKANKREGAYIGAIDFFVDSRGGVHAPRQHPFLTGKLSSAPHGDIIRPGPVFFMPIADQKLFYQNALEAINSFTSAENFPLPAYDASGLDISWRCEGNGASIWLDYDNGRPREGLPKGMVAALASLRRNLPPDYSRFFEFLKVPKWADLPKDERDKFAQCALHNEWMSVRDVPIAYGLPAPREAYWEAARTLFPNSRNYIWGGCVLEEVQSAKTLYCPTCRSEEKEWVRQNEWLERIMYS